jgi:hypothetical protein
MDDSIRIGAVGAIRQSRSEPALPRAPHVDGAGRTSTQRPDTGVARDAGTGSTPAARPAPKPAPAPLRPEVKDSEFGGPQVEFIDVHTGEPVFSVPSDAALAVIDAALWRVGVRRGKNA